MKAFYITGHFILLGTDLKNVFLSNYISILYADKNGLRHSVAIARIICSEETILKCKLKTPDLEIYSKLKDILPEDYSKVTLIRKYYNKAQL